MKLFSLLAITGINGLHHHFGIQTGGSSQPQPAAAVHPYHHRHCAALQSDFHSTHCTLSSAILAKTLDTNNGIVFKQT